MTRSARARLWLTWALRDARSRWAQIISIGLLLALGVGMYSAMSSMSTWRTASADASFAALRMHDLRVALTPGSYVAEGRLSRALASIPDRSLVTGAAGAPRDPDSGRCLQRPAEHHRSRPDRRRLGQSTGGRRCDDARTGARCRGRRAADRRARAQLRQALRARGGRHDPARRRPQSGVRRPSARPGVFRRHRPGSGLRSGGRIRRRVHLASDGAIVERRARPGQRTGPPSQARCLARDHPGRARPLAATRRARHRIHVHSRQPGGRPPLALQGRRRRSADDEHLRRTAARSSGVRRLQSRQPHGRGAAP